jgi:sirohydrochlorin ferrochelatase
VSGAATALVLFAHGSSVESANEAVRDVCRAAARSSDRPVEAAFLEGGRPDLSGAVRSLIAQGAERVIVIPYFLTLGLHLQRDLPKLVEQVQAEHPDVAIEVTPPLDGHPALVDAVLDRAANAIVRRDA